MWRSSGACITLRSGSTQHLINIGRIVVVYFFRTACPLFVGAVLTGLRSSFWRRRLTLCLFHIYRLSVVLAFVLFRGTLDYKALLAAQESLWQVLMADLHEMACLFLFLSYVIFLIFISTRRFFLFSKIFFNFFSILFRFSFDHLRIIPIYFWIFL